MIRNKVRSSLGLAEYQVSVLRCGFWETQAAVDAVREAGNGMIYVPKGHWLTAPFNLTSHCTLFLDTGAVVYATNRTELWPIIPGAPSYGQGRDHVGPRRTSLIHGEHLDVRHPDDHRHNHVLSGTQSHMFPI